MPHESMQAFVSQTGQAVGLPEEKAELLAEVLTANDLRGVFSHGTQQIAAYARMMRDGKLNSKPELCVVRESPVSVLVDGDGGLGYFPAYEGTLRAIEKAKSRGVGVMLTRNHGHFGAAGIYARLSLGDGLLTLSKGSRRRTRGLWRWSSGSICLQTQRDSGARWTHTCGRCIGSSR